MSPGDDRFRKADELLDRALDLPVHERDTFLDEACGGDTELRALVGRLIDGADTEGPLLGEALKGPLWQDAARELGGEQALAPGAVVDRYRIVREIGRGGMAVVYLAERADGALSRRSP